MLFQLYLFATSRSLCLQMPHVYCYLLLYRALDDIVSCYLILTTTLGEKYRGPYSHFTDEEVKTLEI